MSATSLLLDSTIKVSLLVIFALAAAALLRNRSAALRHSVISAAILGAGFETPIEVTVAFRLHA